MCCVNRTAVHSRKYQDQCALAGGADCCALTFDLTNPASFDALDKWKDGFIENAGPDDPKTFPFVLIGNKVDRVDERKVSEAKA